MNIILITCAYPPYRITKNIWDEFTNVFRKDDDRTVSFFKYSLKSWEHIAKVWGNTETLTIEKPAWGTIKLGPKWQRWLMLESLVAEHKDLEKILVVDADTIVKWDCPNLFEKQVTGGIAAVKELGRKKNPQNMPEGKPAMANIKHFESIFPEIEFDPTKYFNSGLVMFDRAFFQHFPSIKKFYQDNEELLLEKTESSWSRDQTIVNFLIQKLSPDFKLWENNFHYQGIQKHNKSFIDKSWVWHFNQNNNRKKDAVMAKTWKKIKHHYED